MALLHLFCVGTKPELGFFIWITVFGRKQQRKPALWRTMLLSFLFQPMLLPMISTATWRKAANQSSREHVKSATVFCASVP